MNLSILPLGDILFIHFPGTSRYTAIFTPTTAFNRNIAPFRINKLRQHILAVSLYARTSESKIRHFLLTFDRID